MKAFAAWFKGLDKPAQIAVVGAIVAGISAIVAAALMTAPQVWTLTRSTDSDLQLVDLALRDSTVTVDIFENLPPPNATPQPVAVAETQLPVRGQMENPVVVLDILLRNTGEDVAVLKTARFEINEFRRLEPCRVAQFPVTISRNYDVSFPILRKPFEVIQLDFPIAQAVAPNAVDRFTITVGPDLGTPYYDDYFIYHGQLQLIYDEDEKSVTSEPFVLALGMPVHEWKAEFKDGIGCKRNGFKRTAKILANIVGGEAMTNPLMQDMFDFFGRGLISRKEDQEQRSRRSGPRNPPMEERRSS